MNDNDCATRGPAISGDAGLKISDIRFAGPNDGRKPRAFRSGEDRRQAVQDDGRRLLLRPRFGVIVDIVLMILEADGEATLDRVMATIALADIAAVNATASPATGDLYHATPSGLFALNALRIIEGNRTTLDAAGLERAPFGTRREERAGIETLVLHSPEADGYSRDGLDGPDAGECFDVVDATLERNAARETRELVADVLAHRAHRSALARHGAKPGPAPADYRDFVDEGPMRPMILSALVGTRRR